MLLFAAAPTEELGLGDIAAPVCRYEDLMRWLPRDCVGGLLLSAGRDEDFRRWGTELLAYALSQVKQSTFSPRFQGVNTYTLNREGQVRGRGFESLPSGPGPSSAPTFSEMLAQCASGVGAREYEKMWQRDCDLWLEDVRKLDAWEGCDLHDFSGNRALKRWRQRHSAEFLSFANSFLGSVVDQSRFPSHLNCFIDAVLCNLLALAPQEALQWAERLCRCPFEVSTYYEVSTFVAALWDTADCRSPEHSALRRRLLEEAQDEGEILALALAAQAEGGIGELWRLIGEELLVAPLAKERALAASILAWVRDDGAIPVLDRLAAEDPSEWVRRQAAWCAEVARGEQSARNLNRQSTVARGRGAWSAGSLVFRMTTLSRETPSPCTRSGLVAGRPAGR